MSSLRHRGTEATLLTLIKEAVDALDNVFSLIFIFFFVVVLIVAQFAVLSGGLFICDTE
jgi:ABC-type transport system involved in cytochrome bd biosynthesis fused ATPase/permease subunit